MEQRIIKSTIKNTKYVVAAQSAVLLLGILKSLVIPGFLSVESFGYWQVYLFYAAYAGIFSLGFNDGIYLLYGKYRYSDLPHQRLRGAIRMHTVTLLMFAALIICAVLLLTDNESRRAALLFSALNIPVLGLYGTYVYVLQVTNQIKRYSFFAMMDKFLLMLSILVIIMINDTNFRVVVAADLAAKAAVVLGMMCCARDLWRGPNGSLAEAFTEYRRNIAVGVKLMIANLMGMFVIGIGRIIVEFSGSVQEYAFYAFGISVTNMVLVLISSVSLVLYPVLKRLPEGNYAAYFHKMNVLITFFAIAALIGFFPVYYLVRRFFPQYVPMLTYLNLLFGVIFLQAKMQLLNNTFYKTLREEKAMLKANMGSVLVFTLLAAPLFALSRSVWTIALCTFVTMLFRCYASEIYLAHKLGLHVGRGIAIEIAYIMSFVLLTSLLDLRIAALIYLLLIMFFVLYRRETIMGAMRTLGVQAGRGV